MLSLAYRFRMRSQLIGRSLDYRTPANFYYQDSPLQPTFINRKDEATLF